MTKRRTFQRTDRDRLQVYDAQLHELEKVNIPDGPSWADARRKISKRKSYIRRRMKELSG